MHSDYPLTIFYDASCPVCALEMEHLGERDGGRRLVLVDMSAPGFDASTFGLTFADLDAVVHALRPDGSIVRGMEVLRLAYAAAGLGWVMKPSGAAPLRPVFDAAYRVFARHRKAISRTLAPLIEVIRDRRARRTYADMARCAGTCAAAGTDRGPAHPEARS